MDTVETASSRRTDGSKNIKKKLAEDEKAVVGVRLIAEIIEVEVTVSAIHVRVWHVDVAVGVRPAKCTRCLPKHHLLNILQVESYLKMLSP